MSEYADLLLARAEQLLLNRRALESRILFDQAETFGADADRCAGGRWTCFMLLGDYERAWQQSDSIRRRGNYDPHRVWDGTPIAGKRVMVRSVHGFGDAVQMLRYMPLLREKATKVILQVSPSLAELARMCPGVDEVIAWEQERPFDVQCEITELPYIFRSTLSTLPTCIPYLFPPSSFVDAALGRLGRRGRMRVGLVWKASDWDNSRSIPIQLFSPLLDGQCDISFWSLQTPADNIEWDDMCLERSWGSRHASGESVSQLAAGAAKMDLVITVDTLAAHLAGALGIPVWVLLKKHADWRWMLDCSDSPWYPTMQLYRQGVGGNWMPVIDAVAKDLRRWTAGLADMTTVKGEAC